MASIAELTKKYRLHEKDTGSTTVQIILLTEEIEKQKIHLAKNKKDVPAKRSLLKKIAQKKKFYQYLHKNNSLVWQELEKDLK